MSNATLRTADQTTHLKIVVLSLIASVGRHAGRHHGAHPIRKTQRPPAMQTIELGGEGRQASGHLATLKRDRHPLSIILSETALRPRLRGGRQYASISLPPHSTGPVGAPVGEPPSGSSETA